MDNRPRRFRPARMAVVLVAGVLLVALGFAVLRDRGAATREERADRTGERARATGSTPRHVGSEQCAPCHPEQARAYAGSHHDRALGAASPVTVLAEFDGRRFDASGVALRFYQRGEQFFIEARGQDQKAWQLPVRWVIGVSPLQQYVVEMPGASGAGSGHLQVIPIAWDARPHEVGGQRFYSLASGGLAASDAMHWSGAQYNWNYMCADCHVTAYRIGYQHDKRAFDPRFAEPRVGCEACHGPGSLHLEWATSDRPEALASHGLTVDLRNTTGWARAPDARTAQPGRSAAAAPEVESCAPCHARRHQVAEGHRPGMPLLDSYRPELLSRDLYHADGQIDDEVYVYGSFLQSRMYRAGVVCSDCHDPHSLALRAEGNSLCGRCHAPAVYDGPQHHHHRAGAGADSRSNGTACVDCHMPATLYMGTDWRRDHSLRIPRPDLSDSLDTPNACTGCHRDKTNAWAAESARRLWGPPDPDRPTYGQILDAVVSGATGSPESALEAVTALAIDPGQAAIVRATALALLEPHAARGREALRAGAHDPSGLVRLGAIYGARGLRLDQAAALIGHLLRDELRAVRIEAARALARASTNPGLLSPALQAALERAGEELLASERLHASRSDGWIRRAAFLSDAGRLQEARAALERALELEPGALVARMNLADVARMQGREADAEQLLRGVLADHPDSAEALHALGLLHVRTGRKREALPLLARASAARPDDARFAYVYIVALTELGQPDEAARALEQALQRHPGDPALRSLSPGRLRDAAAP